MSNIVYLGKRPAAPPDLMLEVPRGNVPGMTQVNKFGRNDDIDSGSGYEAIWNGGASYTGHDATGAEVVEVVSADANDDDGDVGARTIQLYGLDANYQSIGETVTLNGTTAVDTVNSYLRLDRMIIRSSGSSGHNEGAITASQKTSGTIFCVLPAEYSQTMICAYTVPAGYTAYLTRWFVTLAGKTNADAVARFRRRPFGEVFQTKEEVAIQGNGNSAMNRSYAPYNGPITEKTDMFVEASADTNNTGIAAGFDLILVDN